MTQNVASNSSQAWAFFMTGGGGLPAKNNSLDNFCACPSAVASPLLHRGANACLPVLLSLAGYEGDLPPQNNCPQWGCVVDEATVYAVQGPWPPAAQAIMDAAGARTTART